MKIGIFLVLFVSFSVYADPIEIDGMPFKFYKYEISYCLNDVPEVYRPSIKNSFDVWSNATDKGIIFKEVTDTETADINIHWKNYPYANDGIAAANFDLDIKTMEIRKAYIYFHTDRYNFHVGHPYAGYYIGNIVSYDVGEISLHEIGHALGLNHSEDTDSCMYPTVTHNTRRLGEEDIYWISYLYPPVQKSIMPTDYELKVAVLHNEGSQYSIINETFKRPKHVKGITGAKVKISKSFSYYYDSTGAYLGSLDGTKWIAKKVGSCQGGAKK